MWRFDLKRVLGCLVLATALLPASASAGGEYLPDYGKKATSKAHPRRANDHYHDQNHWHYHYGFTYNYPYVVPYAYHPPSYYRPYYNHHLGFKLYYRPHASAYGTPWPGTRYFPSR